MQRLAAGILAAAMAWAACARADQGEALEWLGKANALYQQRLYDQALDAYAKSLRLDNHLASGYQGVGNCYLAKGDKGKAAKYYRYALQLSPGSAFLRGQVAQLEGASPAPVDDNLAGAQYYQQRRYDEAIAAYSRALQANPRQAKTYQVLGNCYYAKGDYAQATSSYRKALDLDPSNSALANFLAAYQGAAVQSAPAGAGGGWIQPAWRSAILPGWGQAYNGQTGKGLILGALTLGLFVGEIATYVAGAKARSDYLSAVGPAADYDGPFSAWDNMANMNHIFFVSMTAAYGYTLADAIFHSKASTQIGHFIQPPAVQLALEPGGMLMRGTLLRF